MNGIDDRLDNLALLVFYLSENIGWFGSVGSHFFGRYTNNEALGKAVCYDWCASCVLNIMKHILMVISFGHTFHRNSSHSISDLMLSACDLFKLKESSLERLQAGQRGDTDKLREHEDVIKRTKVGLLRWCLFFPPALGWYVDVTYGEGLLRSAQFTSFNSFGNSK